MRALGDRPRARRRTKRLAYVAITRARKRLYVSRSDGAFRVGPAADEPGFAVPRRASRRTGRLAQAAKPRLRRPPVASGPRWFAARGDDLGQPWQQIIVVDFVRHESRSARPGRTPSRSNSTSATASATTSTVSGPSWPVTGRGRVLPRRSISALRKASVRLMLIGRTFRWFFQIVALACVLHPRRRKTVGPFPYT